MMKLFRILFGAMGAFALVAAFTGAWHQLIMAAICAIMWFALQPAAKRG
jgi:hypothetical protein